MNKYIAGSLLLIIVALAFIAPDWLAEHPTAAVALGVGGALVVVGLALLVGVVIGGYWTRRAMADGAQIALKAQAVNDTWDAKKTAAFAGLIREGAAIGRQSPGNLPALPALPGQAEAYLPPLVEFGQAHFQVIDNDGEVEQ